MDSRVFSQSINFDRLTLRFHLISGIYYANRVFISKSTFVGTFVSFRLIFTSCKIIWNVYFSFCLKPSLEGTYLDKIPFG